MCEPSYKDPNEHWTQDPDGFRAELERDITALDTMERPARPSGYRLELFTGERPEVRQSLIKHWVQAASYVQIFGDSGAGKTFFALDMFLSIASPYIYSWHGYAIKKHGPVAFLESEGIPGLAARIVGFCQTKCIPVPTVYISKSAALLTEPEGFADVCCELDFVQQQCGEIVAIVIDTLAGHMSGDENSKQDATKFNNACMKLIERYGATVAVIHHTGVNPEAKNRARGSSAFFAALDTQIQTSQATDRDGRTYLTAIQRKQKDLPIGKPLQLEKKVITVDGWYDEDGDPVQTVVFEDISADRAKAGARPIKCTGDNSLLLQCYVQAETAKGYTLTGESGESAVCVKAEDVRAVFYAEKEKTYVATDEPDKEEREKKKKGALSKAFRRACKFWLENEVIQKHPDSGDDEIYTRGPKYLAQVEIDMFALEQSAEKKRQEMQDEPQEPTAEDAENSQTELWGVDIEQ